MRLRIPEVFKGRTAYQVAVASSGILDEGTLYRLQRRRGVVKFVSTKLMQSLCDVLEISPDELLDYERQPVRRPPKKRKPKE
jgi:DNA-binding Xre family transcriptional regulator